MKREMISVVIPCYRSEETIAGVVDRVEKTIIDDGRYDYEIICVNDYSPDNTLEKLREVASNNRKVKVISLSRNFGQHGALMAGFHYIQGDIVVCLDDDGETPPEEMFKLIDEMMDGGYDLVSARYEEDKRGIIRAIGSKISFAMSRILVGRPKDIQLNSFYTFRSFIIKEVVKYDNPYPFVHGLILRVTKNMANVDIERGRRITGDSGYTLRKLIGLWMNGFTAFSEKPLRLATYLGMISSFAGFLTAVVIIVKKIANPDMPMGYASMMTVMMFMFGIIMLVLGLLGEYIGRMYISINNAPQFVVKEEININEEDSDS
ncbi:glycosyltransferase family 2 protein [Pseudobutyrivibrio sp.]|uniref:glycosyltransferase family 2 protein n=1 Tax=Pseudobutyrivibrio sp. TaxID=2014367 RepID=UPI0025D741A8|nr:glycosyltransferase family 2 protein [Pseudobutyrivibrio sp.]MBR5648303.1 glycosyltransferase family 2 protein [Pseudobutyrivibrio sp.]